MTSLHLDTFSGIGIIKITFLYNIELKSHVYRISPEEFMMLFDKLIQTTKVNLVKENFCMEEYNKGRESKNLKNKHKQSKESTPF